MVSPTIRTIVRDGISYLFDRERDKVLSITRTQLQSGLNHHNCSNQFMRSVSGDIGIYRVPRNATIVGCTTLSKSGSWKLCIQKQGSDNLIEIDSVLLLNIDLYEGDLIQFFCKGINIAHPRASLEIAWRL